MIETRLLHYFLAVAREQSFTRAAEVLEVSQPTLSKQLMELEKYLGKQLFIRSSKGLTLTKDGLYLQSRAAEVLNLLHQTEATFRAGEKLEGGEIRIGCAETFLPAFAVSVFRRLHECHPGVRLHVHNESGDTLMEHMEKGLLDMAFLYTPTINTAYDHYPMPVERPWGLLMPRNSPLAQKSAVSLDDLKLVPLIYPHKVFYTTHHPNEFSLSVKDLNIAALFSFFEEAARLADMGLGHAYVMEHTYDAARYPDLVFRPVKPKISTKLYLITKKNQTPSPAAACFLRTLLAEL